MMVWDIAVAFVLELDVSVGRECLLQDAINRGREPLLCVGKMPPRDRERSTERYGGNRLPRIITR